jgi:hypothetical protein
MATYVPVTHRTAHSDITMVLDTSDESHAA